MVTNENRPFSRVTEDNTGSGSWAKHALGGAYKPTEPKELLDWYWWCYSGKGPRWPCWECRTYHRKLYSDHEDVPAGNLDYGIQQQTKTGTQWEQFQWKWYCFDCLRKLGVLW